MNSGQPHSLQGLRVLDMSRVLAGPFCSMILADLGAEVIKIETPWGDDSRNFGPDFNGDSAYYRLFNRSKKGITLNLKEEADLDKLRELVKRSDVMVENFRPGVMEKLGISPESLLKLNPQLIVTSISGFGQTGSMSKAPAYDLVAQAMSGIMSITGWPGGRPTRVGISLGDLIPGLYGAIGTLGALQERHHTGRGQHVDVAMFDSLVSVLESVAMRDLYEEEVPTAVGSDHAMTVPFSTYRVDDGEVVIAILNEKLFGCLTRALGLEYMVDDPRYNSNEARKQRREEVRSIIEDALRGKTVDQALALFQEHGVPTAPVHSVDEALHGKVGTERKVLFTEADGFTTLSSPLRLTGSRSPEPAPQLGEHNSHVPEWLAEPVRG
ncbi:CaiB/BaiF CoA transferase family protein [Corynebacterium striatum]|nr:CoA transferase [Corynebacterium striatum]HAT1475945.1 CoA transferase [Corynebacterium striatum]HCG2912398.1 CoA transferase [Corynebacterium striatum]HCG2972169.1 CoA transferase [Corynebacterium striatum]HCG2976371.1 CoA transferase [Corynebacterium striatum]